MKWPDPKGLITEPVFKKKRNAWVHFAWQKLSHRSIRLPVFFRNL